MPDARLEKTPPGPDLADLGTRCARCGARFACGALDGRDAPACWCAALPALDPLPEGLAGCLCPDCLRGLLADRAEAAPQST